MITYKIMIFCRNLDREINVAQLRRTSSAVELEKDVRDALPEKII